MDKGLERLKELKTMLENKTNRYLNGKVFNEKFDPTFWLFEDGKIVFSIHKIEKCGEYDIVNKIYMTEITEKNINKFSKFIK